MKILIINVVCGIRSTGRICTDLADELTKYGHKVKIAYGRDEVPEQYKKYAIRIGNNLDVYVHALRSRLLDDAGFGSKWYTECFIKQVKKYNPDVIHLHNLHGYYINVEVLFNYLRICGKRIIWTLHDCWAFTGHSVFCDAISCTKWKEGCGLCPQISEYPKSFVDRSNRNWKKKKKIFSNISNLQIVTPSYWLAELVKKSYIRDYKVTVIHNGIDTTQFYPLNNDFRQFYHLEEKFIILAVASTWNKMRGYEDYIKLSNMLDKRFKIVMVGLTKKQIGKLPTNILGLERTTSTKELAMIYSASDVFLDLTYEDNYLSADFVASTCGLQVVTYIISGSCESIKNGITVKKGDLRAVKANIEKLIMQRSCQQVNMSMTKKSDIEDKIVKEYITDVEYADGYFSIKNKYKMIGKKVVLAVSALWEARKGIKDVIEIGRNLSKDYITVVIGVDMKQKGILPKNMIAVKRTNNIDELRQWYSIADVFINPTYEDNYPTTIIEAEACGTPVVTYDTGGCSEGLNYGYGKSILRGNKQALADALKDGEIPVSVYLESLKNKEYLDYKLFVNKYIELYKNFCNN